jgi:Tfp pilus assembly protein PilP
MHSPSKIVIVLCLSLAALSHGAEEPLPSDKMREATGKLNKVPASIGQSLRGLTDAAATKLKQLSGSEKPVPESKPIDMTVPQKKPEIAPPAHVMKPDGRDPFRPMTLKRKAASQSRENLSPLEQKDLSQFNLVGIIANDKEPVALIEDTAGLGYTIKIGTPIGMNNGKVKAIRRNLIIVEENCEDAYGIRKLCEIRKTLPTEP